jgi:hypothetical protein
MKPDWLSAESPLPRPHCSFANFVSIVAVHGLGGDAFKTWANGDQNIWLRDFLPSQVPNARIMSYGYSSTIAFSKSVAGIDEFAVDLINRLDNERESAEVIAICIEIRIDWLIRCRNKRGL